MMTNLFSMFDPSSAVMKMNWSIMMIPIAMMSSILMTKSKIKTSLNLLMNVMKKEIKQVVSTKGSSHLPSIFMALFLMIMMINSSALLPFVFASSAHIVITFPLAMVLWASTMAYGITQNTKPMIAHLVPVGTPYPLMPLMVVIEMVSNAIRPITLSVRLAANMLAGHLLMNLLGSFALMSQTNMSLSSPMLLMLTFLEMSVSMIQAYVFTILISLYSSEVH